MIRLDLEIANMKFPQFFCEYDKENGLWLFV